MSTNLDIESTQVIQIDENYPKIIKKDEWEKCCKCFASLSIAITIVFIVIYIYNRTYI